MARNCFSKETLKNFLLENHIMEPEVWETLANNHISPEVILAGAEEDVRDLCRDLDFTVPVRMKLLAAHKRQQQPPPQQQQQQPPPPPQRQQSQPQQPQQPSSLSSSSSSSSSSSALISSHRASMDRIDEIAHRFEHNHTDNPPPPSPPLPNRVVAEYVPENQNDIEYAYNLQKQEMEEYNNRIPPVQPYEEIDRDLARLLSEERERMDVDINENQNMDVVGNINHNDYDDGARQIEGLFNAFRIDGVIPGNENPSRIPGQDSEEDIHVLAQRMEEFAVISAEEDNIDGKDEEKAHFEEPSPNEVDDQNIARQMAPSVGTDIHSIPQYQVSNRQYEAFRKNKSSCIICRDDFNIGDMVRTLPTCNCHYHAHCIEEWVKSQKATYPRKAVECPVDRTIIIRGQI